MNQMLASWQLWALLAAFFAALTAVFAKVGVADINSDLATFVRTIVVIVALGGLLLATGQFQVSAPVTGQTWLFLILSGLATGASWICYFRALKLGDVSRVAPVDKLSVVMVAIFGMIFLGERLSPVHWAGLLLVAGGAVLLAIQ